MKLTNSIETTPIQSTRASNLLADQLYQREASYWAHINCTGKVNSLTSHHRSNLLQRTLWQARDDNVRTLRPNRGKSLTKKPAIVDTQVKRSVLKCQYCQKMLQDFKKQPDRTSAFKQFQDHVRACSLKHGDCCPVCQKSVVDFKTKHGPLSCGWLSQTKCKLAEHIKRCTSHNGDVPHKCPHCHKKRGTGIAGFRNHMKRCQARASAAQVQPVVSVQPPTVQTKVQGESSVKTHVSM